MLVVCINVTLSCYYCIKSLGILLDRQALFMASFRCGCLELGDLAFLAVKNSMSCMHSCREKRNWPSPLSILQSCFRKFCGLTILSQSMGGDDAEADARAEQAAESLLHSSAGSDMMGQKKKGEN